MTFSKAGLNLSNFLKSYHFKLFFNSNLPTFFQRTQFTFNVPNAQNKKLDPVPDYNQLYRNPKPKRIITAQDSVQLPCDHYKPPASEIKTWMFDGFRKWCPYCKLGGFLRIRFLKIEILNKWLILGNQLTKGENIIRSGQQLSGLARWRMAAVAK